MGSCAGKIDRQRCSTGNDSLDIGVDDISATLAWVPIINSIEGIDLDEGRRIVVVRLGGVHNKVAVRNRR